MLARLGCLSYVAIFIPAKKLIATASTSATTTKKKCMASPPALSAKNKFRLSSAYIDTLYNKTGQAQLKSGAAFGRPAFVLIIFITFNLKL